MARPPGPRDRERALARCASARLRAGTADRLMEGAIRQARAAGCSLRDISEASGIPRSSLHRQLKEAT